VGSSLLKLHQTTSTASATTTNINPQLQPITTTNRRQPTTHNDNNRQQSTTIDNNRQRQPHDNKELGSMATRFMTDPHAMRAMAGRFETHAQTVSDEARRMWASSQNIAGAGWSGTAQATSYDTMGQMNQAFTNIVNMLHGVRDGLVRDANNYEVQEQGSQQALGS
jgi:WXG100 family type VII secretion target